MKNKIFFVVNALVICAITLALAQEETPLQAPLSQATGQNVKVSLDIKGMDLVDVLKILATRAGVNIVIGQGVAGRTTLFLKDVDVWDAFEIIVAANNMAYEKKGEIVNVMTQKDYELIYGKRYQDKKQAKIIQLKYAKAIDLSRALNQMRTDLGRIIVDEGSNTLALIDTPEKLREMEEFIKNTDLPIQTRVFGLNYAQADKLSPKLQEAITKGVGSIKIDERTNKIVVSDYPQKLDELAKIIAAFDEKTPQVLIDVQIIEIKPSDKFEMGVDWDYWITKYFELKLALPISATNRLVIGTPSKTPGKPGEYKAIIDLLRTIGDTKVLSSPRITALNNQEAKIHLGTRDAYITSTTSQSGTGTTVTSQSVNFVDTGIQLSVTPTINRDGFVTMKIRPEVSSAETKHIISQDLVTDVPIVSTSEAETTVMIKDGVTIIIGGLKKDERIKTVKKIPVIGDIPLLGFLFRSTSDEMKTTELVILLTPHIVSGETSYVDFSEIRPREGAIAKMVKGEVITDKMSTAKEEKALSYASGNDKTARDYYNLIINKINQFAKANRPKDKYGQVTVVFRLSSDGNFIGEPYGLAGGDPELILLAVKAVKDASPFPVFPQDLRKEEEDFRIALEYK